MAQNKIAKLRGTLLRFVTKAGKRRLLFSMYENAKEMKAFSGIMSAGMLEQIQEIATSEFIKNVLKDLAKLSQTEQDKILRSIKAKWKPASKFIDEQKVFEFVVWAGEKGGTFAKDRLGIADDFSLGNERIRGKLEKRTNWLLESIDDGSMESLKNTIIEGIDKDMTPYEMRNLIVDRFSEDIAPYRAEMITRTEFANAATLVSQETYKKNGIEKWEWVFEGGDCDICAPNDGEQMELGEEFSSGDERPPAHPNCRCDVIPVVPSDFDISDAWLGE